MKRHGAMEVIMEIKRMAEHINSVSVRKKAKRLLAAALALLMVNPITGYGVSAHEQETEIITAFAQLSDGIATQQLPVGAEESDIHLPDTLNVTVSISSADTAKSTEEESQPDKTATEESEPDESIAEEPQTDGTADRDSTVSGNDAEEPQEDENSTVNSTATDSEAMVVLDSGKVPLASSTTGSAISADLEAVETEQTETEEITSEERTLTGITWQINAERSGSDTFDSESAGAVFFYEPVLRSGYALADGVSLPQIEVRIEDGGRWAFSQSQTIDGIEITVKAEKDVFPEGAVLHAKKVTNAEDKEKIQSAISEEVQSTDTAKTVTELVSFDITITDADGKELQPDTSKGEVRVSFAQLPMVTEDAAPSQELKVYHMDDTLSEAKGLDTTVNQETESVEATAEHFSLYTVVVLTATAASVNELWVGNTNVVQSGGTLTENTSGLGWSYDSTTATLTLNGANITTTAHDGISDATYRMFYYGIYCDGDLNIIVTGDSTIDARAAEFKSIGIYVNGILSISGSTELTAKSNWKGMYVREKLILSDAVTLSGIAESTSFDAIEGVNVVEAITVSDTANLTGIAKGGKFKTYGITCSMGNITIESGATLTGRLDDADTQYDSDINAGVSVGYTMYYGGQVLVEGTLVAHAGNATEHGHVAGLSLVNVELIISENGSVNAKSGDLGGTSSTSYGVDAQGTSSVQVNAGGFRASGESCAVYPATTTVTINGTPVYYEVSANRDGSGSTVCADTDTWNSTYNRNFGAYKYINATTLYEVYVNGTQVTRANRHDVLGDGTVSYLPAADGSPARLTLNGAELTTVQLGGDTEFALTGASTIGIVTDVGAVTVSGNGDLTITGSLDCESTSLTVQDGASLTVQGTVKVGMLTNNGSLEVQGTLLLPDTVTALQVQAMNLTGSGTVKVGSRIYMDGVLYTDGGVLNPNVQLNLTTPPEEATYYKANRGYILYTPASGSTDAILTLHDVQMGGVYSGIVLPSTPVTLYLAEENEMDYIGASDDMNITGNGTLNTLIVNSDFSAELTIDSGATVNVMYQVEKDGVTTNTVYGSYYSDDSYVTAILKLVLTPGAVLTVGEHGTLTFYENTTLSDLTLGAGASIVNNGMLILPAGTTADQVAALPLSGSGLMRVATAYSEYGRPSTWDKLNQSALTIDNIETKTYGDDSFSISATGGSGIGAVAFESSDLSIISISGNTATIHKAGAVSITAIKEEDNNYNERTASVSLTIGKKAVIVQADEKPDIIKGSAMPEFTYTVTGLVDRDTFINPTISTTAMDTNTVGEYDILISGGTFGNADSYTVTYENGKMQVVNAVYTVTFELNGGTRTGGGELVQPIVDGGAAVAPTVTRSGYTFTGWDSAFDNVTSNLTVKANWSYNGGGFSSGGGSTTTPVATPEKKPNQPVTATAPVTAIAGKNGAASATIPDKTVTDAIAKAQADAKVQGKTDNGISVALNVTMPKGATSLTADLTRSALDSLVSAGVSSLEIDVSLIQISFDKKALTEIQKHSTGNISIFIAPKTNLSDAAKKIIGTRPVYDITVGYGSGKSVSSFGGGIATVSIPYTLGKKEAVGGLYAVYVDAKGNATRIAGSAYDANSGCVIFTTTHFSQYGIGYTAPSAKFTDINTHWAKDSVDYVVGRGLLSGTSDTAFSPNSAMTRGMLVTALGRLAGVDVKAYTTNSFTDVKADSTFRPYIEWAYKKGIVQGIGNQQFAPDRAITREEIAVIFANYAKATGYTLPVTREAVAYADASSIGSSYNDAVKAMQQAGIMMGGNDNKFNPKANATRAELSSMLHRYIKLTITPATAQGWALNDDGQYLYYKDGKALTGTQTIDGVKYFFETNGTLKTGWVKDGDNWRFYSGNNRIAGKWLELDGKWYYFNADGSLARSTKIDEYEVDENGVRKIK